mgnify:CR=1 FL=1
MNKELLVDQMAKAAEISKVKAAKSLQAFMDSVTKALKSGKKVTLVGFGTFTVIRRAARKGRNPATGEPIRVKAKRVVKFRAGYDLQGKL